jgi:hypothetical protein
MPILKGLFKNLCQSDKSIDGKDGELGSLIKQLAEATLSAEIDSHLTQDLNRNCKEKSTNYECYQPRS